MGMELRIERMDLPAPIVFNYEELKGELQARVQHYEGLVYSESEIRDAKADRANLNKLKKALNDERIKREREYNVPFQAFKAQINEIIDMIDKPIAAIDAQIKAYEEERKAKKRADISTLLAVIELPFDIPAEKLFDERWLNVSYTGDKIGEEIDNRLAQIQADEEILENLTEYQTEAILTYKETLDIRAALKTVEMEKEKAEQKARVLAHIAEQKEKYKASGPTEAVQQATVEEPVEEVHTAPVPTLPAAWLRFEAYLTSETAEKLKVFFKSNGIVFRRA